MLPARFILPFIILIVFGSICSIADSGEIFYVPVPEKHIPKLNGKWTRIITSHSALEKKGEKWAKGKEDGGNSEWIYDRKNHRVTYLSYEESVWTPLWKVDCVEYMMDSKGLIQQAFQYEEGTGILINIVIYEYGLTHELESLWEINASDGRLSSIEFMPNHRGNSCPERYYLDSEDKTAIDCCCVCNNCESEAQKEEEVTDTAEYFGKWFLEKNANGDPIREGNCYIDKISGKESYSEERYTYTNDQKGNWIKQELEEMKSSKCFEVEGSFRPISVEYREIQYNN